jgi:hypothetical protein
VLIRNVAIIALAAVVTGSAQAQESATVDFKLTANQQSLRDPSKLDEFQIALADREILTQLTVSCQAGSAKFGGLVRSDEKCEVKGNGSVINPSTGEKMPRTQYLGGYTVNAKQDGLTDMSSIKVNYLAIGTIQPSAGNFGGNVTLLPESPPPSVAEMKRMLEGQLKSVAGAGDQVVINDAMDSVKLENLQTPSAGFPSDKGCIWNGDMVYAYATESWLMNVTARCGDQTFSLQGNMPWVDVEGSPDHNAKYVLNLTVPSDKAASDAGMWMTASGDDALFAAANGIKGTIKIQQTGMVNVEIKKGVFDDVATQTEATATLTGTGVPLGLVRSFATIMSVLARTFFGA